MQAPTTPGAVAALATAVQAAVVGPEDSWTRVEAAEVELLEALVQQGVLSKTEAEEAHVEQSECEELVSLFVADEAYLLHVDGTVEAF